MIDWSQLHSWIHAMQERHVHAMPLNGLLPQICGEFARLLHFAVAALHFHAEGPELLRRHVFFAPKSAQGDSEKILEKKPICQL